MIKIIPLRLYLDHNPLAGFVWSGRVSVTTFVIHISPCLRGSNFTAEDQSLPHCSSHYSNENFTCLLSTLSTLQQTFFLHPCMQSMSLLIWLMLNSVTELIYDICLPACIFTHSDSKN